MKGGGRSKRKQTSQTESGGTSVCTGMSASRVEELRVVDGVGCIFVLELGWPYESHVEGANTVVQ